MFCPGQLSAATSDTASFPIRAARFNRLRYCRMQRSAFYRTKDARAGVASQVKLRHGQSSGTACAAVGVATALACSIKVAALVDAAPRLDIGQKRRLFDTL